MITQKVYKINCFCIKSLFCILSFIFFSNYYIIFIKKVITIDTEKKELAREKLIVKIAPKIIRSEFKSLRMDDIAKHMSVSKGTMYKYFSSREDIIEGVINNLIDYINESVIEYEDKELPSSYINTFQLLFEKSVLLAAYIPDIFTNNVKSTYPDLYKKLIDAINLSEVDSLEFYERGKRTAIFNNINVNIIFMQNNILIRSLLDIKFLMKYNLSINNTLIDYYNILKYQIINPAYLDNIDDSIIQEKVKHISDKLTKDLI